jgi:membrane associated rhomboid family serine protease
MMADGLNKTKKNAQIPSGFALSLAVALVFPVLIGLFARTVVNGIRVIFLIIIFFFPLVMLCRMLWDWTQNNDSILSILLRYLRPVPPGAIFSNDLKRRGLPLVTICIIAVNCIVFVLVPDSAKSRYVFLPVGNPTGTAIVLSVFTSAFLHQGFRHLLFNMLFLWGFGSSLETRLGWRRFSFFYLAAIIGSTLLVYVMLTIQSQRLGRPELIAHFHSLGASGAIAGIMGLFVVRCFFARVDFSMPILAIPVPWAALGFFSFPLRLQAPVLVGFFFALDISGSVAQFHQAGGHVNYWAHVGGYLSCIVIGLLLGLHREAGPDAAKTRAGRFAIDTYRAADAEAGYHQVLASEPYDLEALAFVFERRHRCGSTKAGYSFARLLAALAAKDLAKAAALCREHFPRYLSNVPLDLRARLGLYFFRNAELIPARLCLERAADSQGPWQPKAMLVLAQTFSALDNTSLARQILEKVADRFSGTLFESEARRLLSEL